MSVATPHAANGTLSPSAISEGLSLIGPSPDVQALEEIREVMRKALTAVGLTFDTLGEQTARVATLGPALETSQQISHLRRQMLLQDQRTDEKMQELQAVLKEFLQVDLIRHLKEQIEKQVHEQIAEEVRQRVEQELKEVIPATLQETVAEQKRQLEEVRRALHNSEARRANSLLRSNHISEGLRPLLMNNGQVHPAFPKDLKALFAMDGTTTKQIVTAYGLQDITDHRERNLNRFMQFCGVSYQMVPTAKQTPAT